MTPRDRQDYAVGQTFRSGSLRVDADRIKAFAAEFDPWPFHLDDAAARATIFRGLAASGWHTAAATMRLRDGPGRRRQPRGTVPTDGGLAIAHRLRYSRS